MSRTENVLQFPAGFVLCQLQGPCRLAANGRAQPRRMKSEHRVVYVYGCRFHARIQERVFGSFLSRLKIQLPA